MQGLPPLADEAMPALLPQSPFHGTRRAKERGSWSPVYPLSVTCRTACSRDCGCSVWGHAVPHQETEAVNSLCCLTNESLHVGHMIPCRAP